MEEWNVWFVPTRTLQRSQFKNMLQGVLVIELEGKQ